MQNSKINYANGVLVVMRNVQQGVPALPINQPIPGFPATPNDISSMTGTLLFPHFLFSRLMFYAAAQCRSLLAALSLPIAPDHIETIQLQTAVRQATGLPAI
jgi:hypothetical protein